MFISPGAGGSRMITMTGNTEMKKFRNSTISGVRANPELMSNTLAARNSSTRESSWLIW